LTTTRRRSGLLATIGLTMLTMLATQAAPLLPEAQAARAKGPVKARKPAAGPAVQTGNASWYGPGLHGRRTASGQRFNQNAMTAAHRTLPMGTRVRVRNLRNNRSVVVTINDRGPHARGRIIDLSRAAARSLGITGVGRVSVERLAKGASARRRA
jgi:rare lipoprotein A